MQGIDLGSIWPPLADWKVSAYSLPILNTSLLVASSLTATVAHYQLTRYRLLLGIFYLQLTIVLGLVFALRNETE